MNRATIYCLTVAAGVAAFTAHAQQSAAPTPSTVTETAVQRQIKAGRISEAAAALEREALRTPRDPKIRIRAAKLHEARGDLTAATRAATEALALDANNTEASAILGRIAAREQDWGAAVAHWRRVVLAEPNNAAARLDYANALQHIGDQASADAEHARFRELVGLPPVAAKP
jgi:Flp pilus assembly protein TadD